MVIMSAGDWNQLSLVQAVLQMESSLLSEYIYTGDTRWEKVCSTVFTAVVFDAAHFYWLKQTKRGTWSKGS